MHFAHRTLILAVFTCLISCKSPFLIVKQSSNLLPVSDTAHYSNPVEAYLMPFCDSLSTKMDVPLEMAEGTFIKERPGGSLGNLFCDAILSIAQQKDTNVLLAIGNYGGLRVNRWGEGPILVRNVYELMPFDNTLVVLDVPGSVLLQWMKHMANMGGWPIGGACIMADTIHQTYQLKMCNSAKFIAIDEKQHYRIATSDYVANGGDRCDFLIEQKQINQGILLRDALMQYVQESKRISPNNEKRFTFYSN